MEVHWEQLHIPLLPISKTPSRFLQIVEEVLSLTALLQKMIGIQKAVTPAERTRIEGYLAHKWGLTDLLSSTHPLTYLSIGEIEFFPPVQVQPAEFDNAIELSGASLELPFELINPLNQLV